MEGEVGISEVSISALANYIYSFYIIYNTYNIYVYI